MLRSLRALLTLMATTNTSFAGRAGDACPGYLAVPAGATKGVVVIQEWWGLNQHMVNTTDKFAAHGFAAVCPDLYRGKVAVDHETAGHLMSGLDWEGAVNDIRGAALHLRSLGCTKVGVVGWCMGGALTCLSSQRWGGDVIDAGSAFYGIPGGFDGSSMKIPFQAHFGDKDALVGFSDITAANKLEQELKASPAADTVEFYHYAECQHAFTNATRPEVYNADAAALAYERTFAFFNKYLA